MPGIQRKVLLLEMPTYPKGVMSLSIPALAAYVPDNYEVVHYDLNLDSEETILQYCRNESQISFIGLKVSSQNYKLASELSGKLKKICSRAPLIWGGEFPSLMPEIALEYADVAVKGDFRAIADVFFRDLESGDLSDLYNGSVEIKAPADKASRRQVVRQPCRYYSFIGMPLETSKGCDRKCTFCMVHHMQPVLDGISHECIREELRNLKGNFVNVLDYNFGVDTGRAIELCRLFRESEILGWSVEMCLETLDNDDLLAALASGRCRIIYCGLESIDEEALRSVNKASTNNRDNYFRIIRKVQSYGIQVAAGLIIGTQGMNHDSFVRTEKYFHDLGIIYTKLTFLTYNPGTKVKQSMLNKGSYLTEDFEKFDGNHLTFIPHGLKAEEMYAGADYYIRKFYSPLRMWLRSKNASHSLSTRISFFLFCYCYGRVYREWLKNDIFHEEDAFRKLLLNRFTRPIGIKLAEFVLKWVRKYHYFRDRSST